jgi:L-gulonolactone oxidase
MVSFGQLSLLASAVAGVLADPFNTFDGPGFPACHDVAAVHNVTSVNEMVSIVKDAAANGTPVRASGKGHMWYDTMESNFRISFLSVLAVYIASLGGS